MCPTGFVGLDYAERVEDVPDSRYDFAPVGGGGELENR